MMLTFVADILRTVAAVVTLAVVVLMLTFVADILRTVAAVVTLAVVVPADLVLAAGVGVTGCGQLRGAVVFEATPF